MTSTRHNPDEFNPIEWGDAGEFPFIGYLDQMGNILEEDVALEQIQLLNEGNDEGEPELTLTDLFQKVETEDFWQAEIDNQDENSEQPKYRLI